jgi:Zn-dependent metalloprotease
MTRSSLARPLGLVALVACVLALAGGSGFAGSADAQTEPESPLAAAERLRDATGGNVSIRWAQATGVARFVRATGDTTISVATSSTRPVERAYAFLRQYGAVFGVVSPDTQLATTRATSDEAGSTVRLAQRYRSLPVFNAELVVNLDPAGGITAAGGTFIPNVKVPTEPTVGAGTAATKAVSAVAAKHDVSVLALATSTPALGVTQTGLAADRPGRQALAWKTTVTGPAVREFVFVDARSGEIVEILAGIHNARQRETFNMLEQSNYDLAQKCLSDSAPATVPADPDCTNAHTFAGDTYNFFFNGFRRDSFDGNGAPLLSYVHYFSTICPNAFWNGSVMTYCSTFPHDDVAGHEITHGVTEFSANLVYAYQPGALNESFSDIFGEAIDLMNSSENEPGEEWRVGEGIVPGGLRDMRNPPTFGDPDSCTSPNYHCAASDSGGVHTNSGVPNKAFVLMVEGGTHNGVTVSGIGLAKASAIQYRALTRYLSVYSNFVDDYEALQASCRDLRNKRITDPDPETGGGAVRDRITKSDCAQVKNALDAVQLTAPVCTTTRPTPAGPLCADGETVASLFYEDHESGSPGWTESLDESRYTGQRWQVVGDFTASGAHAWRVNDELTSCSSGDWTSDVYLVSPQVNLTGTSKPVLRFVHDFFTEGGYDGGTVEVLLNGSWVKLERGDFTLNPYNGSMNPDSTAPNWTPTSRSVFTGYRTPGDFPTLSYSESRVDLSSYAARDTDRVVQFRFRFGTDFCNGTDVGWYLDDVEVYDCKAGTSVTAAKP